MADPARVKISDPDPLLNLEASNKFFILGIAQESAVHSADMLPVVESTQFIEKNPFPFLVTQNF